MKILIRRHTVFRNLIAMGFVFLLAAAPLVAQQKPDFSGEWTLNKEKSRLQYPEISAIERGTVTTVHKEPSFHFERVFFIHGREDTLQYDLSTTGEPKTTQEGRFTDVSKLYWDGDTPVLENRITGPQGEATNTVRYRLLDGGKTLEAEEHFRGPRHQHDNQWVFDRK
jgi:hypothetical protein